MKIESYKQRNFTELNPNSAVRESDFEEMVDEIMNGLVIMINDGETEISISNYVKMSLIYDSEPDLINFFCGNTKSLENINAKMRKNIAEELLMALNDNSIEVK